MAHGPTADDAIRTQGSDARGAYRRRGRSAVAELGPNTLTAREGRSWWARWGRSSRRCSCGCWWSPRACRRCWGSGSMRGDRCGHRQRCRIPARLAGVQPQSVPSYLQRHDRALKARVVRGGVVAVVPAADIVPGDVLVLEAGDLVAADGGSSSRPRSRRLKVAHRRERACREGMFAIAPPPPADTPLAERRGMVHFRAPPSPPARPASRGRGHGHADRDGPHRGKPSRPPRPMGPRHCSRGWPASGDCW